MDLAADEHAEHLVDLGAYALGGLGPARAVEVREHATRCAECRQQLDEFAEVTAMLALVPLEALLDGSPGDRAFQF
jgi:anti-sigma factor RsiW